MEINKLGKYRMRNGNIAIINSVNSEKFDIYPIQGHIPDIPVPNLNIYWMLDGKYIGNYVGHPHDLIEYMEEPKPTEPMYSYTTLPTSVFNRMINILQKVKNADDVYDVVFRSPSLHKECDELLTITFSKKQPDSVALSTIMAAINRSEYD